MPASLQSGQSVKFTVIPVKADGSPSNATLSNITFTSSDPALTVVPDPAVPNGGIATAGTPATSPDAVLVTATTLATEPDGKTTETISGSDTVTINVPAPPPPAPAASLVFSFGTPQ